MAVVMWLMACNGWRDPAAATRDSRLFMVMYRLRVSCCYVVDDVWYGVSARTPQPHPQGTRQLLRFAPGVCAR